MYLPTDRKDAVAVNKAYLENVTLLLLIFTTPNFIRKERRHCCFALKNGVINSTFQLVGGTILLNVPPPPVPCPRTHLLVLGAVHHHHGAL